MTARFGRNKRRAALAAVAAAQAETASWKNANSRTMDRLADERDQRQHAEAVLGEIRARLISAVGTETALLPLSELKARKSALDPWATLYPVPHPVSPILDIDDYRIRSPQIDAFSIRRDAVQIFQLVAEVEERPTSFETLIRFESKSEDRGGARYTPRYFVVSTDTLHRIGLLGQDLHRFAEDIVKQLTSLRGRR